MSGLERVIVGYPEGDPRIRELWERHGRIALPHRKCIAGCNRLVYFVESGQDAIRTRDPEVICDSCRLDPDIWANVYKEL